MRLLIFVLRYADKFLVNGTTTYRNLNKVYGVRIIIITTGQALKPDFIGIFIAFLAFFTLFSFSIIFTDFYILNCYASLEQRSNLKDILVQNDDEKDEYEKSKKKKIDGFEKLGN